MGRLRDTAETLSAMMSSSKTYHRILGLGFYQAWMHVTFLSPAVAGTNPDFVEAVRLGWLVSMAVAIPALLAVHRAAKKGVLPVGPGTTRVVAAVFGALGTVIMGLSTGPASLAFATLGAAVTGIGAAGLVLACGSAYDDTSRIDATFAIGVAYALSFLVYLPITFAGPELATGLAAGLPVLAALTVGPLTLPPAPENAHTTMPATVRDQGIVPRFAQTMFVFGVALGLMWSINVHDSLTSFGVASRLAFLGAGAAGVVIALWSLMRSQHIDLRFVFAPVLPLIIAGFLLLPIVGPENVIIANTAVALGFMCFEMLTWVALSAIVKRTHRTPARVFGKGKAISYGGVLAGGVLGSIFVALAPDSDKAILLYSFGAVMSIISVVVYLLGSRDTLTQTLGVDARESASSVISAEALRDRDLAIAGSHRLTARESDVFLLLALGRSLPFIEEELHISHGTSNTHLRNIYRKLDVHNRQEFLNLLESERNR